MLICAMFATRLSPALCGMYTGVLTVALPVVGSSTGVALAHERDQRFPRLPEAVTATGCDRGGRDGRHGSCFDANTAAGVQRRQT